MRLRSLLFVPGDRPDRMLKAAGTAADALILDLEDSVTADRKDFARCAVADFLGRAVRPQPLFVRINPLGSRLADDDLAAVIGGGPDGIVLPKSESGALVGELAARLQALGDDRALILPIATETPAAVFGLGSYAGVSPRLCGLTWGAEDLPAAIGAATAREDDGSYTAPYQMVRALLMFGAHAAGVPAIETVYPAINDPDGLARYAARGQRDGFTGMMAIHPSQVALINRAFSPSAEEIAWAEQVVALFDNNPGIGSFNLNGTMVDAPHLKQAMRILALRP